MAVNVNIPKPTYTKSDVGLGNVDNTSDLNKPISTATQTALDGKVDKVTGKGLSENDFTNTLKTKLDGIQDGAEVNVNADWNATSGDAQILNKPTIPDASDFVAKTDYSPAHSILAQQSGTGAPSSVSIGTNEILGRLSDGGSAIKGLSVSEVKDLLDLENSNTGDETQASILSKLGWVRKIQKGGTITGTVSETLVHTFPFTANEYPDSSILHVESQFIRTGTPVSNAVFRIRINTANTLVGSTQIGQTTIGGNSNLFSQFRRKFDIESGLVKGINSASSINTDLTTSASFPVSVSLDTTQNWWLFITYQPQNINDIAVVSFTEIKNF